MGAGDDVLATEQGTDTPKCRGAKAISWFVVPRCDVFGAVVPTQP